MSRALGARGLVLALLVFVAAAGTALAAPKFPPLTGRVVDAAGLVSPAAEVQLTEELAALERSTGRQMVVVTLPDLGGYPIEDYGYQLGRHWGIGRKDLNDGLLFIVAPNERAVRFEVGYGLEPVFTDTLGFIILQERVLPAFREGRMEEGVLSGARAAMEQLALPEDEAKARLAAAEEARAQTGGEGGEVAVFLFIVFVFIVLSMLGGGRRRRRRGLWWLLPILLSTGGSGRSGGGFGRSGGFGGGGFRGGGGSFGGGGASGRW